ncbi:MAG: hypothetical protein JWP88_1736 [Flaviaesturariibacter sp.]|nr:hypothetical protein [Flaviaesturariibacter sp.]
MLIVCNISLLSAQESTAPAYALNTTEPTVLVNSSTSFAKAPIASQAVATKKSFFRFGERVVTLAKHTTAIDQPYVLISLHNDEYTASEAARKAIQQDGGSYIEVLNNNERNIAFTLFNKEMTVDPNNIFTPKGRWADLAANQKTDHVISQQIGEFAKFIIDEIPVEKAIISLHNNTEDAYTIDMFQKGGCFANSARFVYQNTEMDENDFVLTTDKAVFEKLKEKKISVVFQPYSVKDNGSLNVFCAKTKRRYIGIETQVGHSAEQEKVIETVTEILK